LSGCDAQIIHDLGRSSTSKGREGGYPSPIVDVKEAGRLAREKVSQIRKYGQYEPKQAPPVEDEAQLSLL
jgi:hypothetical protein